MSHRYTKRKRGASKRGASKRGTARRGASKRGTTKRRTTRRRGRPVCANINPDDCYSLRNSRGEVNRICKRTCISKKKKAYQGARFVSKKQWDNLQGSDDYGGESRSASLGITRGAPGTGSDKSWYEFWK